MIPTMNPLPTHITPDVAAAVNLGTVSFAHDLPLNVVPPTGPVIRPDNELRGTTAKTGRQALPSTKESGERRNADTGSFLQRAQEIGFSFPSSSAFLAQLIGQSEVFESGTQKVGASDHTISAYQETLQRISPPNNTDETEDGKTSVNSAIPSPTEESSHIQRAAQHAVSGTTVISAYQTMLNLVPENKPANTNIAVTDDSESDADSEEAPAPVPTIPDSLLQGPFFI